ADAIIGRFDTVSAQAAHAVMGTTSPTSLPGVTTTGFNLSSVNGTNGIKVNGSVANEAEAVGQGDFNGDGLMDIVVAEPKAAPNGTLSTQTYVVLGTPSYSGLNNSTLNLSGNGVLKFNGPGPQGSPGGIAVTSGDIDGDGLAELIIGMPKGTSAGQVYVLFGSTLAGLPN